MIILRNSEEANIFHFFLKFSFFFIKIISALLLESFQIVLKTVVRSLEKEKSLFLVQMCYWFQDQVKKKKKYTDTIPVGVSQCTNMQNLSTNTTFYSLQITIYAVLVHLYMKLIQI